MLSFCVALESLETPITQYLADVFRKENEEIQTLIWGQA